MNATKMWYDEYKDYNYSEPGFSKEAGHFTQVIWKENTICGFGYAHYPDGSQCISVGRYKHGNMQGAFEENVPDRT